MALGIAILFLPESPRYSYRTGRKEEAREVMARLSGYDASSAIIDAEIAEIEQKLHIDSESGSIHWIEIFTGPRMLYRTLLGMLLQAGQQLTGVNFFFYYGTTIFRSTGIDNSYITAIILGTVNVVATIGGLWLIKSYGRRRILMVGAICMCVGFLVYAFVGTYALDSQNPMSTPVAGTILIVFTCLVIAAFAVSWGPLVWTIVSELYPARYRAPCMALATSSNWMFNFLISFCTTFITDKIHYFYGLVFAAACVALCTVVYFFVIESKDRSLEEIDTMYLLHVNPRTSAKWEAKETVAGQSIGENPQTTEQVGKDARGEKSVLVHGHY
jgi:SP family sugar:H+ symporter-like MFS transporter